MDYISFFLIYSSGDRFKLLAADNKELNASTLRPNYLEQTRGLDIARSLSDVNDANKLNTRILSKKLTDADGEELNTWTLSSKDHIKGFPITNLQNDVNHTDKFNARVSSKKLTDVVDEELKTWALSSKDHIKGLHISITRSLNDVNHTDKFSARKLSKAFKSYSTSKKNAQRNYRLY